MKRLITTVLMLLVIPAAAGAEREQPAPPGTVPVAKQETPSGAPLQSEEAGGTFAPDQGQYLPDTAVLARIDRRVVRVIDFRDRYFSSDALTRPTPDSLGRVEFLNSMINKDVMGLTALAINRPLTIEDRIKLREFSNVAIQNVMHQRMVLDSISISEEDLRAVYPQYSYEQHLRGILFDDRATAERARADLLAGRISWKNAVRKYSKEPSQDSDGDLGWVQRSSVSGNMALKAFSVQPGGISEVVQDTQGYRLFQCVERRAVTSPAYPVVRRHIARDLHSVASAPRMQRLFQAVRAAAAITYDTTNIKWAVAKFSEVAQALEADRTEGVDLRSAAPRFDSADTGRVLARSRDRRFTVKDFVTAYEAISPLLRRRITGIENFLFTLDGMFLEPQIIAHARAGGFDKDSLAVAMIEHRREELLVEHLFEDSILSRVSVTPAMRKRYYRDHQKEFVSIPYVRYARLVRRSEAAADSLVARLRAGEPPEAILAADSLRGEPSGAIGELSENQRSDLHQVLFEELKPGQVTKVGPDAAGHFMVIKLLAYEASRPMTFAEVEPIVDESVQNTEAERLLKAFLVRHQRRYRIEAHPELVMQILLSDPALELRLN